MNNSLNAGCSAIFSIITRNLGYFLAKHDWNCQFFWEVDFFPEILDANTPSAIYLWLTGYFADCNSFNTPRYAYFPLLFPLSPVITFQLVPQVRWRDDFPDPWILRLHTRFGEGLSSLNFKNREMGIEFHIMYSHYSHDTAGTRLQG